MILRRRKLTDQVVVITGASSGVGSAAARAFSASGAKVVLAARRERPLRGLAAELGEGRALAVPTDVRDQIAVDRLAEAGVERFGRLDVWFNNAGVGLLGRFDSLPPDAFRAVVETNYFGTVHGSRAALSHFEPQCGGVVINNASIMAVFGSPYASAYVSAKWAVRGFSESLRAELRGTGIEMCTLLPGPIDTPFFEHTGNFSGQEVIAMKPLVQPDRVARAVISLARRPRAEVIVGRGVAALAFQKRITPRLAQRGFTRSIERGHFGRRRTPGGTGAIFASDDRGLNGW